MFFPVLADVFKIEPARQGEVELHGRKLPFSPYRVEQLYVDLRSVEGRFVGYYLYFEVQSLARHTKGILRESPLLLGAVIFAANSVIPSRQFRFVTIKSKGRKRIHG